VLSAGRKRACRNPGPRATPAVKASHSSRFFSAFAIHNNEPCYTSKYNVYIISVRIGARDHVEINWCGCSSHYPATDAVMASVSFSSHSCFALLASLSSSRRPPQLYLLTIAFAQQQQKYFTYAQYDVQKKSCVSPVSRMLLSKTTSLPCSTVHNRDEGDAVGFGK
jgi:hypothetical protein